MKKNDLLLITAYSIVLSFFTIYTYGFVDNGLMPYINSPVVGVIMWLRAFVLNERHIASITYISFVTMLFLLYVSALSIVKLNRLSKTVVYVCIPFAILIFSYPAFSYDIFNYILTSKITYYYQENPYVTMPVEIPNEPMLGFTRAANKVALYGPVWISATYIPYLFGQNNIWLTIYIIKLCNAVFLAAICYLIYKSTGLLSRVLYVALNPLILVEVLVSGHNDTFMMLLAISGLLLYQTRPIYKKVTGLMLLVASIFVKGATLPVVIVTPFIDKKKHMMWIVFGLMATVFFITPLREELYPWYAVWFLSIAPFLEGKYANCVRIACAVFSYGLLLRHAPYIYTGRYEGWGPILRTTLTIIPPALFIFILIIKKVIKRNV